MAKSQQTFDKKEKEKKRLKKRKEKEEKKAERKANSTAGGGMDSMMAYLDADGNIVDTPPDPTEKREEVDADSIVLGIPKKEEEPDETVREGKVNFFDDSKGFGFIIDGKNNEKYFVHVSGTTEPIQEGDKVQYELEQGMKGMNAVKVKRI